jgi:hypothetical protein
LVGSRIPFDSRVIRGELGRRKAAGDGDGVVVAAQQHVLPKEEVFETARLTAAI